MNSQFNRRELIALGIFAAQSRTFAQREFTDGGNIPVRYEKVISRTIMLMYDGSSLYTNPGNLASFDGGLTYPLLDRASRFPRVVVHLNDYQQLSAGERMVDYLKARNPSIEIYAYRNVTEYAAGASDFRLEGGTALAKINGTYAGKDWWLRTAANALIIHHPNTPCTNYLNVVGADSNGRMYSHYAADYFSSLDARGSLNGKLTGWFCDNTLVYPYFPSCDWFQTGVDAPRTDPVVIAAARDGHYSFLNRAKSNRPRYKMIGNSEQEFTAAGGVAQKFYSGDMLNYLDGGMFEYALDDSRPNHAYLPRFGWAQTYSRYRQLTSYMNSSKLLILHGVANGNFPDYKRGRLTICTTLLGDGICYYDSGVSNSKIYLDEYDVQLGAPIEPAPTDPLGGSNLWTRKYENGIVVVNGSNAGTTNPFSPGAPRTFLPPPGVYRKFLGSQDRIQNDGQVVGAEGIRINGWDACILLCVINEVHSTSA